MDKQKLQQRIVGAIVLVGLGVIFIPMILSSGRDGMPLFGSNIPDKPRLLKKLDSVEISPRSTPPEKAPILRIPVENDTPPEVAPPELPVAVSSEKGGPAPRTRQKEQEEEEKQAKAWVVQVGSFSKRDNAMKLRNKLRQKNYPAFVELLKNKEGQIYRVRVGPEVTRTLAEERMRNLRDNMKIYGVVMSHP